MSEIWQVEITIKEQLKWFENTNLFQEAEVWLKRKYFDSCSNIHFEDGEVINPSGNEQELTRNGKTNPRVENAYGIGKFIHYNTQEKYKWQTVSGWSDRDINEPEK